MRRTGWIGLLVILSAACQASTQPSPTPKVTPVPGGLTDGAIAFADSQGIAILDPSTGKVVGGVPIAGSAGFQIAGPTWAQPPGAPHPVLYFSVHDGRPAETSKADGALPYDWLFRYDPFSGKLAPVMAEADLESNGPFNLYATGSQVILGNGCCGSFSIQWLDFQKGTMVTSTASQASSLEVQGLDPQGLIALKAFDGSGWYSMFTADSALHSFGFNLGPDDGPISVSGDGSKLAAATGGASPEVGIYDAHTKSKTSSVATGGVHPDSVALSPDGAGVAIAVSGQLEVSASGKISTYAAGTGVSWTSWSPPIVDRTLAQVTAAPSPQSVIDQLLAATLLPAASATPDGRATTNVYLWRYDPGSPIANLTQATPDVLQRYPPLPTDVGYFHWYPTSSWSLAACKSYRVIVDTGGKEQASSFQMPC